MADEDGIRIIGARQNNLRDVEVTIPLGALTAITGVSGSGKSSLAFDTLYAEGQRRYVESFSPYARQFMDRMDRPAVTRVEGVLPAVAIEQRNAIKAARSTVGTVTELTDFIKLLYASAAVLHCEGCGEVVASDEPGEAAARLIAAEPGARALVGFTVPACRTIKATRAALDWLAGEGYRRLLRLEAGNVATELAAELLDLDPGQAQARALKGQPLRVVVDRLVLSTARQTRLVDSLEGAMRRGQGRGAVWLPAAEGPGTPSCAAPRSGVAPLPGRAPRHGPGGRYRQVNLSRGRHCAACDRSYAAALPNHFSYNSPLGACETCNGFGAVIDLDLDLVIPDHRLSIDGGAIRPWTTERTSRRRSRLRAYCREAEIATDVPWGELTVAQRARVVEGDPGARWPGVRGWFRRLERKVYKMHVRVLLARYRTYRQCPACGGARLKPHALLYRLGGLDLAALYRLTIDESRAFFDALTLPDGVDRATSVLTEIRARLGYLCDVGVGYLTLDRKSRTLSGGEVQRVNLTTAIGSALVNTLYVLDEPSVGLHPRDNQRLLAILERLRRNRNTIVVVEHDEAIIRGCDHLIDLGPGPGERGGRVVYSGPPSGLHRARAESATARYLDGRYLDGRHPGGDRAGGAPRSPRPVDLARDPTLAVRGAREHNLAGIDVDFPLGRLTVLTGVSGSGKSTLLEEVLHRGLMRRRGRPTATPGACDGIEGWQQLGDVVIVDQSPVGTTPRSNPATYVKAFDGIRKLFAEEPRARQLGLSASAFSFNVPGGRCEACQGNGFERVEMQFLSDRFVTCDKCGGKRFKPEVLQVRLGEQHGIDDVLRLTVEQATALFSEEPTVVRPLSALVEAGLGYLRLGQPLNTLSGGESQRLKLAAHLAPTRRSPATKPPKRGRRRRGAGPAGAEPAPALLLLDEPTTGLHLADVARLVDNLHALVDRGHTVVVIEHHLDVIAAADWVVDLGPEGGGAGGRVVDHGPPSAIAAEARGPTGEHLAAHLDGRAEAAGAADDGRGEYLAPAGVVVRGARVNNLRNIDVELPRGKLVVISGPSGSGKSSLAFDVLYAEGQRRFIDCLSPYARQYISQIARPELDELLGVPPTICISQRTSRGGQKSTVATITEIYHYLRLLYARIGRQHCHRCGAPASGLGADDLRRRIVAHHAGQRLLLLAPAVRGRKGFHRDVLERAAAAGCPQARIDGELVSLAAGEPVPELARYKEHDVDLVVADLRLAGDGDGGDELGRAVARTLHLGEGTLLAVPVGERGRLLVRQTRIYSQERYCADCGVGFEPLDPRGFSFNSSAGACRACQGSGLRDDDDDGRAEAPCPACGGARLRPEALAVRLGGRSIAELTAMTAAELGTFFARLDGELDGRQREIAAGAVEEIAARAAFLDQVGLDYLTLDRSAVSLSGGEAQRVRLAAQLSADLRGVLYVLDEPTIGLHPVDNERLLAALRALVDRGNTVVVVEHDEETIRRADHLLELGPGGGARGGEVVAAGTVAEVLALPASPTGRALRRSGAERAVSRRRPVRRRRAGAAGEGWIGLRGVRHHNLRDLDVDLPLGRLTVVTGVSGSGKSSLVRDVLADQLRALLQGRPPTRCDGLPGAAAICRVREIDQSPIGKTPSSTPATYVGLFDEVRRLFARLPEARAAGYSAGRFSFNVKGGRCETCRGQGQVKHEMSFLPDVRTPCEACGGQRYNLETLRVRYRERSIAELLGLTAAEALELLAAVPKARRALELLCDVGLDYLTLGQPSNTLSGGEAQRIKLVEELQKEGGSGALYVLDEPSTGLHWVDLERLLGVLQRLVDRGDTVVVIEHNLDVVASADWVIDLGPGGGARGGRLVHQGPPKSMLTKTARRRSQTARYLAAHLEDR